MKQTVAIQTINKISIHKKLRRLNKKCMVPTQTTLLLNPYHSSTRQDWVKMWPIDQYLTLQAQCETNVEIMIKNTTKTNKMIHNLIIKIIITTMTNRMMMIRSHQLLSNARSMCLISIWTWFQMNDLTLRAKKVHLSLTLITISRVPPHQTTNLRYKCKTTRIYQKSTSRRQKKKLQS